MKKIILTLVLMAFSMSAMALDKCFEGNWYDPTTKNGVGIDIEVLEDRNLVLAHYYTWFRLYDDDPVRRDAYIFLGKNDIEGAWAFNAYQTVWSGGPVNMHVGTGSVIEIDNNTIRFEYDFRFNFLKLDDPNVAIPWCIGCSRDVVYKRLTAPHPCD